MEKNIKTIKTGLKVKWEELPPVLDAVPITQTEFTGAVKERLQQIKNLLLEQKALSKSETMDEDIEYLDKLLEACQKTVA